MQVIAKTESGLMIEATHKEVRTILQSVTGEKVKDINIGQKIPAIDYASSIEKIKTLKGDYIYEGLCRHVETFNKAFNELEEAVEQASSIEV